MREEEIALLRCPICRGALAREGGSLVCAKRHCYDLSRQGDVNLEPGKHAAFYTKELFASRAWVFESGLYDPVVRAIGEAAAPFLPGDRPGVLVDAGCGEGFYTGRVLADRALWRVGFDLSKDAVRMAARRVKNAAFVVGDLARIPLADGCCDVLLDVFSPANYAEFARVLRPGGALIKLAPRGGYLRELRETAGAQLRRTEHDGGQVEAYLHARTRVLQERTIAYTLPVSPETVWHLARMTPMLAGVDLARVDLSGIREITIDETMYVCALDAPGTANE